MRGNTKRAAAGHCVGVLATYLGAAGEGAARITVRAHMRLEGEAESCGPEFELSPAAPALLGLVWWLRALCSCAQARCMWREGMACHGGMPGASGQLCALALS